MSNTDVRRRMRAQMFNQMENIRGQPTFENQFAMMQAEILDEYLEEKIRSNKVIEGVLKDIRGSIDEAAKANQQIKLQGVTMEAIKEIVKSTGERVSLASLEEHKAAAAQICVDIGLLAGVTDDDRIINVELYQPPPQGSGNGDGTGQGKGQAADQGQVADQGGDSDQGDGEGQKSESAPEAEKTQDKGQGL